MPQQGYTDDNSRQFACAGAFEVSIPITASGNTTLVALTAGQVAYISMIDFAIPGGTGIVYTLQGSDGTVIDGPLYLSSYNAQPLGKMSTNNCAVGSNLVVNFSAVPSTFRIRLVYYIQ